MLELKLEEIDGEKFVTNGHRFYKFVEEFRGVREKFWLILSESKFIKEPLKNKHILFKYNRNDVSCENWGEIYASRIAKQIGVPCVEYYLAKYEENGKVSNGVMCGTYKKNEKEFEATVYDIQTMQNEKVEKINAVDDIIENLMLLIPEGKDKKFYHSYLRNSLIKQCIFDFLLAQTDRHWFNTTFLIYVSENAFNVRKAECYDNGCIAYLKRKYAAIVGISREIQVQGENSQRLHDLLKDYVPMMGIKTPTVELNTNKDLAEAEKLRVLKDRRDIFLDELTDEILNNPEIAKFYMDVKKYLNVKQVTNLLEREKTPPPQAIADMVELVSGYQLNLLDELVNEKINNLNSSTGLEV
ncbi:MAG: hypothetical protein IJ415_02495 [Clostridia bacterium]|nr:hypothetical protein [Clostridia bacterium]